MSHLSGHSHRTTLVEQPLAVQAVDTVSFCCMRVRAADLPSDVLLTRSSRYSGFHGDCVSARAVLTVAGSKQSMLGAGAPLVGHGGRDDGWRHLEAADGAAQRVSVAFAIVAAHIPVRSMSHPHCSLACEFSSTHRRTDTQ